MSVHSSVYIMYSVRNRRYTGRSVEGVYTEFYSCGRILSMSGHMSVYGAYTGRIKGYTEGGVDGMCTDFVYLMDNGSGFRCGISSGRVYGYSNLSFETDL